MPSGPRRGPRSTKTVSREGKARAAALLAYMEDHQAEWDERVREALSKVELESDSDD